MEETAVLLDRSVYGHPSAGLLVERRLEEVLFKHKWENTFLGECPHVHIVVRKCNIKMTGKNIGRM